MNESARNKLLSDIDAFEASPAITVEEVQTKLQQALMVWEGSTSASDYDAIDLAENALEEILHARLLEQQRDEARSRLRVLREQLTATV